MFGNAVERSRQSLERRTIDECCMTSLHHQLGEMMMRDAEDEAESEHVNNIHNLPSRRHHSFTTNTLPFNIPQVTEPDMDFSVYSVLYFLCCLTWNCDLFLIIWTK